MFCIVIMLFVPFQVLCVYEICLKVIETIVSTFTVMPVIWYLKATVGDEAQTTLEAISSRHGAVGATFMANDCA